MTKLTETWKKKKKEKNWTLSEPLNIFIQVFGAFCSMYWRERKKSNKNVYYFGTGETFVFTLSPERKKYEWVGLHEENVSNTANMFLAGDSKILTIGGG